MTDVEIFEFLKKRSDYDISFTGVSKSCCVGVVDIVNSTAITAKLSSANMCEYYSIFLNTMSKIVRSYGATIVKNIGDSLLYYFPNTTDGEDDSALVEVLDCGLRIMDSHKIINLILAESGLPPLDYRISADYGMVSIASLTSKIDSEDMFGPTVNLCSKLNGTANPNSMVIGGDLHQLVRSLKSYEFTPIGQYMLGLKLNYPAYLVRRTRSRKWYSYVL
jgi:class 3 adenylate cyclase